MEYKNPVINADFPDPSVIEVPGDGYYAYASHDSFSPTVESIQVAHSKDLVNWTTPKAALIKKPNWAKECKLFWAPHVVKVGDEYRMYYSADPDTHDGMCIALAVGKKPDEFRDIGRPLMQGSSYRMIDPHLFIDPPTGTHYLFYGSAHDPISAVEMEPDGMTFKGEPIPLLYPDPSRPFESLREGAFVSYLPAFKRYFLWVSGNNTWESGEYAITVFWSNSVLGPFLRLPEGDKRVNSLILQPTKEWDSPGQNCLIMDKEGQELIVYHAVDPNDRFMPGIEKFLRKMCMQKVFYTEEGWPYIAFTE